MATYILYDDRGIVNPDDGTVLCTFDAKDDMRAIEKAIVDWEEYSWALYKNNYLIAWQVQKGDGKIDYWDIFSP